MLSLSWRGGGIAAGGTWRLRQGENGEVALGFARDGQPVAQALGRFAAFAEAMLALRLYETAPPCPPCRLPWRLTMREGLFLLRHDPDGLHLDFRAGREGTRVAWLSASAMRRDAAGADLGTVILRRLAELRGARPDTPALEPLVCRDALG